MRLRPVPERPKRFALGRPGSGARPVVTRDHDEDGRTAAIFSDAAAAPLAHGRIGREQRMQGRLGRRRNFFDAPVSAGGPVGRGGEQAIDFAGQRRQSAGAI